MITVKKNLMKVLPFPFVDDVDTNVMILEEILNMSVVKEPRVTVRHTAWY